MFLKLTKSEAKAYGKLLYKKWIKQLTKAEITSLRKYKGVFVFSNYQKINTALREDNVNSTKNDIINISSAIEKSIVDRDIVCLRNSSVKFLQANGYTIETLSPGSILVEKGFMSTYLFKPKIRCTSKLVLVINVPKGTRGAYINNILPWWSGNKSEYELLFDKNTKLKVLEKSILKNRTYLVVEMFQT